MCLLLAQTFVVVMCCGACTVFVGLFVRCSFLAAVSWSFLFGQVALTAGCCPVQLMQLKGAPLHFEKWCPAFPHREQNCCVALQLRVSCVSL